MKRLFYPLFVISLLTLITQFAPAPIRAQPDNKPDARIAAYQEIVRGAKTYDGVFKLHQKDDQVYAELQPVHLNRSFLLPIAVAKGAGVGGSTLNFDEQWVLMFKRVGDKVHLIRRNVHHKAKPGSPTAKAVDLTYSDSVLMALRIVGLNQMNQGILINFNDIFMSDFGEFGLGRFDSNRSVWHKIKNFPKNMELQIQATFTGGGDGDKIIDGRGTTVIVHYGLSELPDNAYSSRIADSRIGYFVTAMKDFSSNSKDTSFVRYINRWRLEPAEPIVAGRLSVPKRSIKFYIEKTVPHEYRAAVQEGILEWNKAFEKIGFRNAIEVVQQRDEEEFDPEDMNYNTFRWITTDSAFAIGPSRANPFTGELLDADILFDGDFVRYWKQERQILQSNGQNFVPVSPIQSMDMGWGIESDLLSRGWNSATKLNPTEDHRLRAIRAGVCQCGSHMKMELGMAALSLVEAEPAPKAKDAKDDKNVKDDKKAKQAEKEKLIDFLLQQAVKEVVMHEVGHTLGLRHNFKASTMLSSNQLHDTKITREKGLVASVMDYTPVNIAPKGIKQGDFFTTTLGPYDYWAIEYGYKPDVKEEDLKKIAARGASEFGLDYGTDEDTVYTSDPHINRFDLGKDVMKFATDRMTKTDEMLKNLSNTVVEDGEGYQRLRTAFSMLLGQYGNGAYLISRYIGGEYAYRDHRGDPKARDPLVPVSADKQREALKFLQEKIFSDTSFQYPPELLRKLAVERWLHWGANTEATDFPIYDRILGVQRLAMNQLLSAKTLSRVQANALKVDPDAKAAKPLSISEVFRAVTDGVWSDLPTDGKKEMASSTIRRNLQREHLKKLTGMVLGSPSGSSSIISLFSVSTTSAVPADAKSLARLHLKQLAKRIDIALGAKPANGDETVTAHLEECKERIAKVLAASMQANE